MSDALKFSIKEVSKMIGVVPGTIRNWEKSGLIKAQRSDSNYRCFSVEDISKLRLIKGYSIDKHMSAEAIKLILGSHSEESDFEASFHKNTLSNSKMNRSFISSKWKDIRKAQGLTLEDVSKGVGISVAHLSKFENGGTLSLKMMNNLAHFYGESPLYFMEESKDENLLVSLENREPLDLNGDLGIHMESLAAVKNHVMYPVMCTVAPGSGNRIAHRHNGEEFEYMISGTLEHVINGKTYIIHEGDSLYYKGEDDHCWWNPASVPAKFLWIHSSLSKG